jgi:magnesium-transporting ATPase (P-type)
MEVSDRVRLNRPIEACESPTEDAPAPAHHRNKNGAVHSRPLLGRRTDRLSAPAISRTCEFATAAHNLLLRLSLLLPAAAVPYQRPTYVDDFQEAHKEPLDINNLLLRGSVLRKTPWAIGMAINVGNDSKIVQNMTKAPRKVSGRF